MTASKNKRRPQKRTRRAPKAKLYRKPKTHSPGLYSFKRSRTEVVDLVGTTGQGWLVSTSAANQGIGKTFVFALSDLTDNSDFKNLFKYYKIKAVRVQMYFSNSITAQDEPSRFPNSQLMIHSDINSTGVADPEVMTTYLNSQTAKKSIGLTTDRKPLDMLMKMKLSNEVYRSTTNTDYTLKSPAWLETTEPDTPHYGMNMFIGRVDGEALTSGFTNAQYVRFIYTYYIQCKKVQ